MSAITNLLSGLKIRDRAKQELAAFLCELDPPAEPEPASYVIPAPDISAKAAEVAAYMARQKRGDEPRTREHDGDILCRFMRGESMRDIGKATGLGYPFVRRVLKEISTRDQFREARAANHRAQVRGDYRRRNGVTHYRRSKVPVGPYPSIAAAAMASGIPNSTAHTYYRAGKPVEKWNS